MQSTAQAEIWQPSPPRILTDAALAWVIDSKRQYMARLRGDGLLRRRAPVKKGQAGRGAIPRYSLLEGVACAVALITKREFPYWPKNELKRLVRIINSGDQDLVSKCLMVQLKGELPGTSIVALFTPDELQVVKEERSRGAVIRETPLIEIVEAVGNKLFKKLVKEGVEFTGSPTGAPSRGDN